MLAMVGIPHGPSGGPLNAENCARKGKYLFSFHSLTLTQNLTSLICLFFFCLLAGGAGKGVGEDPDKSPERGERGGPQSVSGAGFCKWFNVRMGFGFISMTSSEGSLVEPPLDVFVHQVSPG